MTPRKVRLFKGDTMPKLPKRLSYGLALAAALLLSSCAEIDDRIDVVDVNARNALAQIELLDSRVPEIESKLNK